MEPMPKPTVMPLDEIIRQACCALAHLDAERLEDLRQCCEKLNAPEAVRMNHRGRFEHGRNLPGQMAVFQRLLAMTEANLAVFNHASMRADLNVEYSPCGKRL